MIPISSPRRSAARSAVRDRKTLIFGLDNTSRMRRNDVNFHSHVSNNLKTSFRDTNEIFDC